MVVKTFGDRDNGLQPAMGCPEVPFFKEFPGIGHIHIIPEVTEVLLDGVGTDSFQVKLA